MKLFSSTSFACMVAVAHGVAIYYQPNGVFVPVSLSIPAVVQQQQQQQQQQQPQQQQVQALVPVLPQAQAHNQAQSTPVPAATAPASAAAAAVSNAQKPWWSFLTPQASSQNADKAPTSVSRPQSSSDSAQILLAQLLAPFKFVAVSFLTGLEMRLERADPKDVANVLRGPLTDFKNYLISIWPAPTTTSSSSPASVKTTQPASRSLSKPAVASTASVAHK